MSRTFPLTLLAVFAVACSGDDLTLPEGGGSPTSLAIVSGDEQRAERGAPLDDPLIVEVTDQSDHPVANVAVEWVASAGSIDPTSARTDASGRSSTRWTLGSTSGEQRATAVVSGVGVVEFTATAEGRGGNGGGHDGGDDASKPTRITILRGNHQTVATGAAVTVRPAVTITDQSGRGMAGVRVTFAVVAGGGDIVDATPATDADGVAAVGGWTLGRAGGTNKLSATAEGDGITDNPVTFTATAAAPSEPERLVFLVQPSRAEEHDEIEPAVQVAVVDGRGTVVPDRRVEIRLELRGGEDRARLRGATRRETSDGIATFSDLRVDRDGEGYRLRASASGFDPIESNPFDVLDD